MRAYFEGHGGKPRSSGSDMSTLDFSFPLKMSFNKNLYFHTVNRIQSSAAASNSPRSGQGNQHSARLIGVIR